MTISIIERKSYTADQIAAGTDIVFCSMPIPPGGVLLGYRAEIHGIASSHLDVTGDAVAAFAKSVVTPMGGSQMDTAISVQTLFDQVVPKDLDLSGTAGADEIDWDDGTIAAPFEEPGHINWNDMMQLGLRPQGIQEKEVLITPAHGGAKMFHVDTTDEYFPTFRMTMGSNRKIRTKQAAYFLLAIASPSWDETTNSAVNTIVDANWSALTYPDVMFNMMMPDILGITETGAESPFVEMAGFAVDLVEPSVFESTGNAVFAAVSWNVWVKWSVRVLTPGEPRMKTLTGGMAG